MVDVQVCPLGAFKKYGLLSVKTSVEERNGIGRVFPQQLHVLAVILDDLPRLKAFILIIFFYDVILDLQVLFDLLRKDLPVEQVDNPDPKPAGFVFVRGPYPPSGCPDLLRAFRFLQRIELFVVGHDDMGEAANEKLLVVFHKSKLFKLRDLLFEHCRVKHYAVSDDAVFVFTEYA